MRDLTKMSDLARGELADLRAAGVSPTDDEIVRLNALAWAVESPPSRMLLARGLPVQVGGVTLWPLTLQAADWWERERASMSIPDQEAALGYAMAHGRADDGPLLLSGRAAEKAVRSWRKGLRCTARELGEASAQIMSQLEGDEAPPALDGSTPDGLSPGDLSAFLTASVGGPPGMWEREVCIPYALAVMREIVRQNRADDKPCRADGRLEAIRALGWEIEKIKRRHAAESGAADGA